MPAVAIYQWTVANGAAARPVRLSGAPLAGLLHGLAWLVTGAGLFALLLLWKRRRRAVPTHERFGDGPPRAPAREDSTVLAG